MRLLLLATCLDDGSGCNTRRKERKRKQVSPRLLEKHDEIDTDRMLDVSVSIRTMSHVTVDTFGDSVWEISNGSGFLVSSRTCEVWTNHHVIDNAALIEVYPRGWQRTDCAID